MVASVRKSYRICFHGSMYKIELKNVSLWTNVEKSLLNLPLKQGLSPHIAAVDST